MNIVRMMLPSSKYSLKSPYSMAPKGIVFHNTSNDAEAENEVSYMIGNAYSTSFHYAVDDDGVVQAIEDNRNAWHCGNTYGNRNYIGIECCYSRSGGSRFTQSEQNSAEFIAYKLKQYGWGIDKLYTHQQMSGKYCPHRTLDMGWERFKAMVNSYLVETPKQTPSEPVNDTGIYYRGHVQNLGDLDVVRDGQIVGTNGQGLRLEGLFIDLRKLEEKLGTKLTLNVKQHIQNVGWKKITDVKHDTLIGTEGESKRIECIELELIGLPSDMQMYYQAHVQYKGWMPVVENGFPIGTTGESLRIEAMKIWIA